MSTKTNPWLLDGRHVAHVYQQQHCRLKFGCKKKLFQTSDQCQRAACPYPHTRGAIIGAREQDQQMGTMNAIAVKSSATPTFSSPGCSPNHRLSFVPGIRHSKPTKCLCPSCLPFNYPKSNAGWRSRERRGCTARLRQETDVWPW